MLKLDRSTCLTESKNLLNYIEKSQKALQYLSSKYFGTLCWIASSAFVQLPSSLSSSMIGLY